MGAGSIDHFSKNGGTVPVIPLGSTRKVVGSDNTVRETINYYPFGSEMRMEDPAQMAGDFQKITGTGF